MASDSLYIRLYVYFLGLENFYKRRTRGKIRKKKYKNKNTTTNPIEMVMCIGRYAGVCGPMSSSKHLMQRSLGHLGLMFLLGPFPQMDQNVVSMQQALCNK